MKRTVLLIVIILLVLISASISLPTEMIDVHAQQLKGSTDQEFLKREGILNQLSANFSVAPGRGRNYLKMDALVASDAAQDDLFGLSVDVDGDTFIVGAPAVEIGGPDNQGAAYIFVRDGDSWVQQQRLTADDGAKDDNFGYAVTLDGDTAVIGAYRADIDTNVNQGAVYVFNRNGNSWTQGQKLTADDGELGDLFGLDLDLSGDTLVVGAREADIDAENEQGAAYVFRRVNGTWNQQEKLTADDGAGGDRFGTSVSTDGKRVLIGSYKADVDGEEDQGAAYLFEFESTSWVQKKKMVASFGDEFDHFGGSVAVDGGNVAIGAPWDNFGIHNRQGIVYVFEKNGGDWIEQPGLFAIQGEAEDRLGSSIDLLGDTIIAGAVLGDVGADMDQGAAYIFTRSGGSWSQQQSIAEINGAAGDSFGSSVAISNDTFVAGAYLANVGILNNAGKVLVAGRPPVPWPNLDIVNASDPEANTLFGNNVSISGDTALIGSSAADIDGKVNQGAAYVFVENGPVWVQQDKLIAPDGLAGELFGHAVVLDGDTAIVTALEAKIGANTFVGAAYVFKRTNNVWNFEQKLTASDGAQFDRFGDSVALDGNTVVIGADSASNGVGSGGEGAAYVFTRNNNGVWNQQQKLIDATSTSQENFGESVDISGNTILIGSSWKKVAGNSEQGAVFVFFRTGNNWSQQDMLVSSDGEPIDHFGDAVAIDKNIAAISAVEADIDGKQDQGAVYIFEREAGHWEESDKLTAPDISALDFLGTAIALDDNTLVIGGQFVDTGDLSNRGSAYIYNYRSNTWKLDQKLIPVNGDAHFSFGRSVSVFGNTVLVGSPGAIIGGDINVGKAYLYERRPPTVAFPLVIR